MRELRIRPLDDRIVVKLIAHDEKIGMIFIPEGADRGYEDVPRIKGQQQSYHHGPCRRGTVIAVGPGKWNKKRTGRVAMDVNRGDVVWFGDLDDMRLEREGLVFIRQPDIALIENENHQTQSKKAKR